jgi:molecular chaperone GrpE
MGAGEKTVKRPGPADGPGGAEGSAGEAGASEAGGGATAEAGERIAALERECAEVKDRWLRAEADLVNYRRRAARDLEEAERRGREKLLGEVLSLADDLERALDAAEENEKSGPIHQGIRLVHERVREILRSHGVEVVDPAGQPFDPHVAEALFPVESDAHVPGTVVSVIEKGYRIGDRLLRAAKVTVARAPAKSAGDQGADAAGGTSH